MSTIERTGSRDCFSALHTYLGTRPGFMSYACLLTTLSSTPPLPRQHILGVTPGLGFLGDPTPASTCGRRPAPPRWRALVRLRRSWVPFGVACRVALFAGVLWDATWITRRSVQPFPMSLLDQANNPRRPVAHDDDSVVRSCTYPCATLLDGISPVDSA